MKVSRRKARPASGLRRSLRIRPTTGVRNAAPGSRVASIDKHIGSAVWLRLPRDIHARDPGGWLRNRKRSCVVDSAGHCSPGRLDEPECRLGAGSCALLTNFHGVDLPRRRPEFRLSRAKLRPMPRQAKGKPDACAWPAILECHGQGMVNSKLVTVKCGEGRHSPSGCGHP